ncbi:hypothetical protein DPM19_15895 [Actinomadura craniellae]|uniref:DUF4157 domain-containing protein n=1 Tax=Actinomadura craniellae TaxID=2231787 RepID=A0A365H5X3_9ACTN|nr:hypothetical protein [Actinomadura craniellae]RAY14438.1 hypothetical protein DPM19_15895 [Actinomadura craniellae]
MRANRADRGEGSASYIAVIVLIGAAVTVVATTGIGATITSGVERSICRVTGGCGPAQAQAEDEPSLLPRPPLNPGRRLPEPTRLPNPSPGPPPPSDSEQVATERVLNETPLGREALEWVRQNGVAVVYRPGGGSFYRGSTNTFYVDSSRTPEAQAATFVHEVNHARHDGTPDPKKMGRDEYIDASINEEVESVILAIRANQQLQAVRPPGSVPDIPFQSQYEASYDRAIRRAEEARKQNNQPPLTEAEKRRIGEEAGWNRLKRGFLSGEITRSTDGKSYVDGYGEAWDDAHDCFLWIFC